jgi:hypothetical protein
MPLINGYRKGWALRYIREARAELAAAEKMRPMASNLLLEAMRKAQIAIYYSLGDPAFVENIVRQIIVKGETISDPILRCLVEIENMIQEVSQVPNMSDEQTRKQADELVEMASDIVYLFTNEKA